MKTFLFILMMTITASLYGQKTLGYSYLADDTIELPSLVYDTIPTIMLCTDTSKMVSLVIVRPNGAFMFKGFTYTIDAIPYTGTFPVIGYRVFNRYLDIDKQPLPKSFIVFGFVDRKHNQ